MKNVVLKIFVVLTFVFAYIITSRTPMMWEDVVYTLKADAALGAAMSNSSVADTLNFNRYNRVSDVEDLVTSSYYHYMNANGRLFPHMTSQTFGALIGKPLFQCPKCFDVCSFDLCGYVFSNKHKKRLLALVGGCIVCIVVFVACYEYMLLSNDLCIELSLEFSFMHFFPFVISI